MWLVVRAAGGDSGGMDTHLTPDSALVALPSVQPASLPTLRSPDLPAGSTRAATLPLQAAQWLLPRGQAATLPAHAVWLQVEAGRIWLTRSDDLDDHFIEAGQTFALEGSLQVVVEADGPGAATLQVWSVPAPV